MGRKIHCAGCKKYLGEIVDAKLRKNISHLCNTCESARKLMAEGKKHTNTNHIGDMFGDIFNR